MNKIRIVFVGAVMGFTASAAEMTPYLEASVGYFHSEPTIVGGFTYFNGDPVTETNIRTGFASNRDYGVEVGIAGVLPNVRFGLSETSVKLRGRTHGTITTDRNGTSTVTYEDLDKGYSTSRIQMLTAYHDFQLKDTPVRPFVGLGVGRYSNSEITRQEPIYSLMAGAKYELYKGLFVGAKATYYFVGAATTNDPDKNSLSAHRAYSLGATLGYQF